MSQATCLLHEMNWSEQMCGAKIVQLLLLSSSVLPSRLQQLTLCLEICPGCSLNSIDANLFTVFQYRGTETKLSILQSGSISFFLTKKCVFMSSEY